MIQGARQWLLGVVLTAFAGGLARRGRRVLVVETGCGFRSLDILLGLPARAVFDLSDALEGRCSLGDAILVHEATQLRLIPAPGDPFYLPRPERLEAFFHWARDRWDFLLLDCGPGFSSLDRMLAPLCGLAVLTATPEEAAARQLEQLREENKALEERHLRLMAEFGNFKNRTAKEKDNIYGDAVAGTLRELLPVLDNLQRALDSPCADEDYKKGVELIHKGLWEIMTGMGVEEIAATGVPFDPDIHNAVMHIEDDSLGKNTVAQVLQKGYRMGERILRYAMVQAAN